MKKLKIKKYQQGGGIKSLSDVDLNELYTTLYHDENNLSKLTRNEAFGIELNNEIQRRYNNSKDFIDDPKRKLEYKTYLNKYAGSTPDSVYASGKLRKAVGSPNVHMAPNVLKNMFRSMYDDKSNTMELSKGRYGKSNPTDQFIAESSHAYQYNKQNKDSLKNEIKKSNTISQDSSYSLPGTIEYNAHKEIEPKLRNLYNSYLDEWKDKNLGGAFKDTFPRKNYIENYQNGGNVNKTGYLKNSKTNKNPYNIIPSGNITTEGMKFPIFANGKLLMPDTGDYKFNTNSVLETPALNKGGQMRKPKGLKKYSRDTLKMQAGGTTPGVLQENQNSLFASNGAVAGSLPQAANLATTLLAPRGTYQGTEAPNVNLANVGNATLAGAKIGGEFGGPVGAGIGAAVAGVADLTKEVIDFDKNKKDWAKNLTTTRAENKLDYDHTHKPYGSRGYMQGTPNEQIYSLYEGGQLPDNRKRAEVNTIANLSTIHGSVSLSKQDGGKIPDDLNELFDRFMDESGGDEEKAGQLVQQYQQHPEMVQNKGKKKPHLKKKQRA